MIGEEVIAVYGDAGDGEELFEVQKFVRCKECKFSEVIQNDSSGVMARYCRAFTVPMMRSDDDFCSYGEREERSE